MPKQAAEIIKRLRSMGTKKRIKATRRFGIQHKHILGVSAPKLRKLAKEIGKDQELSIELWNSGIYEAMILASLVGEPSKVTERQMGRWVNDIGDWAVCDSACGNLFDKTKFAYWKAIEWSSSKKEFVKRAGFVLMAELAVHDKAEPNNTFLKFLPIIKREACDERNFVWKAVNWSLREIGKRNLALNKAAIKAAMEIHDIDCKGARYISSGALRELRSDAVQRRLSNGTR